MNTFSTQTQPRSPCTMSGKRGADQVAEGDEELEDEIRKKVKEAHEEYDEDEEKEDLEKRLMVHPSPYPLVSRSSI